MKAAWLILFVLAQLHSTAQEKYKKVITGKLDPKTFSKDAELKRWFEKEFESYQPKTTIVAKLKEHLAGKKIIVVLGTWCSDSQREFPRLMKVLSQSQFPESDLKIYGVNRKKTRPAGIARRFNITHVPTILLLNKDGTERGRIIETVKESVEADLLSF